MCSVFSIIRLQKGHQSMPQINSRSYLHVISDHKNISIHGDDQNDFSNVDLFLDPVTVWNDVITEQQLLSAPLVLVLVFWIFFQ